MVYKYDSIGGELVELTAEQITALELKDTEWEAKSVERKLQHIKNHRLERLQQTDFWVLRGDITEEQKTWRQSLRDIPANHTDEAAYDLLLASDADGVLTHSIWTKP